MRSNIAGRGLGAEVVVAGLRFAKDAYSPPTFRLTVAAFHLRAVRMYECVGGFEVVEAFGVRTLEGGREWLLMRREA